MNSPCGSSTSSSQYLTNLSNTRLKLSPSTITLGNASFKKLQKQINLCLVSLKTRDTEWLSRTKHMTDLGKVVEKMPLTTEREMMKLIQMLLPLVPSLVLQLKELRSSVVKTACETLSTLARVTHFYFQKIANLVLPALLDLSHTAIKVIARSGDKTIRSIILYESRFDLTILSTAFFKDKHGKTKTCCLEYIGIVIEKWPRQDLQHYLEAISKTVRSAVQDAAPDVRFAGRKVFIIMCNKWNELVLNFGRELAPEFSIRRALLKDNPESKFLKYIVDEDYIAITPAPAPAPSPAHDDDAVFVTHQKEDKPLLKVEAIEVSTQPIHPKEKETIAHHGLNLNMHTSGIQAPKIYADSSNLHKQTNNQEEAMLEMKKDSEHSNNMNKINLKDNHMKIENTEASCLSPEDDEPFEIIDNNCVPEFHGFSLNSATSTPQLSASCNSSEKAFLTELPLSPESALIDKNSRTTVPSAPCVDQNNNISSNIKFDVEVKETESIGEFLSSLSSPSSLPNDFSNRNHYNLTLPDKFDEGTETLSPESKSSCADNSPRDMDQYSPIPFEDCISAKNSPLVTPTSPQVSPLNVTLPKSPPQEQIDPISKLEDVSTLHDSTFTWLKQLILIFFVAVTSIVVYTALLSYNTNQNFVHGTLTEVRKVAQKAKAMDSLGQKIQDKLNHDMETILSEVQLKRTRAAEMIERLQLEADQKYTQTLLDAEEKAKEIIKEATLTSKEIIKNATLREIHNVASTKVKETSTPSGKGIGKVAVDSTEISNANPPSEPPQNANISSSSSGFFGNIGITFLIVGIFSWLGMSYVKKKQSSSEWVYETAVPDLSPERIVRFKSPKECSPQENYGSFTTVEVSIDENDTRSKLMTPIRRSRRLASMFTPGVMNHE